MNLKSAVRSPCISAVCSTSLFVPRWAGQGRMVLAVPGVGLAHLEGLGGSSLGKARAGQRGVPVLCSPSRLHISH